MKKTSLILASSAVLFISCATPSKNAVSDIPWDDRVEADGNGIQYGAFQDADVYGTENGMINPEMSL